MQDKYITISLTRRSIEEARTYFHRVDADLSKTFGQLDSGARPLENQDRLRIFHDFFRPGEEEFFHFDLSDAMRKGHDFRELHLPRQYAVQGGSLRAGGAGWPRPVSPGVCQLSEG